MDFKTCKQPTYWEGRSNIQINLVTRTINWFEHRSLVWWILMVTRRQQSPFWSELLSHVKTNTAVLIKTKSYLLKSRRPNISLVLVLQTHFDSVANSAFHQRIIWMKPSPAWLMYKATCLCPLSWRIGRFFLAKHVCSRLCLQTQPWRKHYFLTFLGLLDLPRMLCAVDIICWPAYRLRLTNRDIARSPSLYWVRMFSFFFFFFRSFNHHLQEMLWRFMTSTAETCFSYMQAPWGGEGYGGVTPQSFWLGCKAPSLYFRPVPKFGTPISDQQN